MNLALRVAGLLTVLVIVFPARAALIDLGNGLIRDTDRGIIWTQSAALPGSQSLNWEDAKTWAEDLVYGGFDDWRLPTAFNRDGTGPCGPGFNCSGSEMGHLFYVELDCTPHLPGEVGPSPDPCVGDQGPFTDIQENRYWTSTPNLGIAAWEFDFRTGFQGFEAFGGTDDLLSAWAVRCEPFPGGGATGGCFPGPGPFPASEPGTLAVFAIALAALAGGNVRKRRHQVLA